MTTGAVETTSTTSAWPVGSRTRPFSVDRAGDSDRLREGTSPPW
jgi:hypothetical protein